MDINKRFTQQGHRDEINADEKKLKNLSKDGRAIPVAMTPKIGAAERTTIQLTDADACSWTNGRHVCRQ